MNKLNSNEMYDPNQNKYYKSNGNSHIINNSNNNGNGTGNGGMVMPRYQQNPALTAIINDAQGIKFRGQYGRCSAYFFCFSYSLAKGDEDALGDDLGHRNKYKRNKEKKSE